MLRTQFCGTEGGNGFMVMGLCKILQLLIFNPKFGFVPWEKTWGGGGGYTEPIEFDMIKLKLPKKNHCISFKNTDGRGELLYMLRTLRPQFLAFFSI